MTAEFWITQAFNGLSYEALGLEGLPITRAPA